MIDRRAMVLGLIASSSLPVAAGAQSRKPLVAMLLTAGPESTGSNVWPIPFREAMAKLGWIEGQNVEIVTRFANDALERMPVLASELVALNPKVLVTHTTTGAQAAASMTKSIPVVVGAAVEGPFIALVGNLARPLGNVTGFTTASLEQHAKVIELLRQVVPSVSRIAILANPFSVAYKDLREITEAPSLGDITFERIEVASLDGLDPAFARMAASRTQALLVTADPTFNRPAMDRRINELAQTAGIAVTGTFEGLCYAGGLLSYGVDYLDLIRRTAGYVDKILKGATPGELPVERPTMYKMVVSIKSASGLGLTVPPSILLRADEVID